MASSGFAVLENDAFQRAPRRQRRIHSLLDLTKVGAHRQHRDVLAELSRWFDSFSLGLGWLDQPLYAFFWTHLARQLIPADEVETMDLGAMLEREWAKDSRGEARMQRDAFYDAALEAIDLWTTEKRRVDEYVLWMQGLFSSIMHAMEQDLSREAHAVRQRRRELAGTGPPKPAKHKVASTRRCAQCGHDVGGSAGRAARRARGRSVAR